MSGEEYDSSSKKSVSKRKTKKQLATEAKTARLRYIMQHETGRAFMYDLLESTHIFQPSFVPDSERLTCYREGERNVGLKQMADILKQFPKEYQLMINEKQQRGD